MSNNYKRPRKAKKSLLIFGILLILLCFFNIYMSWMNFFLLATPFSVGALLIVIYAILNSVDKKTFSRWNQYETLIDKHGNTYLDDLASKCGKSYKRVCRDLQDMIDAGEFGGSNDKNGAYIDYEEHFLVMSKNGRPIIPLHEILEEDVIEVEGEEITYENITEELDNNLFGEYIHSISCSIDKIADKENKCDSDSKVKDSLRAIEHSIKKIQAKTDKHPELKDNAGVIKLTNSHLPHLMMLIENYLDETASEKSLNELCDVFIVSEEAFTKIDKELSKMMDEETTVNIRALQSELERDGLTKSDFDLD